MVKLTSVTHRTLLWNLEIANGEEGSFYSKLVASESGEIITADQTGFPEVCVFASPTRELLDGGKRFDPGKSLSHE
jgi:hypothetical protein